MKKIISLGFILFLNTLCCFADDFTHRPQVRSFIKDMVKHHHFSERQLTDMMRQIHLRPDVIESMEKPYEKKTWDVYRDLFLTTKRVQSGLDFWMANQKTLNEAHQKYKVPPEIIVAILGVETLYGERQGEHPVLDTLATLAFNYPKRSAFFKNELKEFLLLCQEQGTSPYSYKGSYAGAIGKPQFMPSSYRYYAIDFRNKGSRDLVSNNEDSIGSIANYFQKHGWRPYEGVVQPATLRSNLKSIQVNPKAANYRYAQLLSAGVKPVTASMNHPHHAGLIELTTATGKEYWMAYPNFFVITRYNSSPQYALVVYLLSQQLKQQWAARLKKQVAFA